MLIPIIFVFLIGIDFQSKQITEGEEKILARVEKLLEHPGFSVIEMRIFAGRGSNSRCVIKYYFSGLMGGLTHVILENQTCGKKKFQKVVDRVIKIFGESSIFVVKGINAEIKDSRGRINILEDITIEQLLKTLYRLATHFSLEKVPDLK